MALLPDLRAQPYVMPYVGSANNQYAQVLAKKIDDYDVAKSYQDALALQTDILLDNTLPFEGDKKYAIQLQDIFRKKIDDWAAAGNYEDLNSQISAGAREFMKRISPIQENYKRYSNYIQELDKRTDVGSETKNLIKNNIQSTYKGLDVNNVSGTLFQGYTPPKDVDLFKAADDAVKGIVDYEWGNFKYDQNSGRIIKQSGEVVSPERVAALVNSAMYGNQEVRDFEQSRNHLGAGNLFNFQKQQATQAAILKYAKNNVKIDPAFAPGYDYKDDQPYGLKVATTDPDNRQGDNPLADIKGTHNGVVSSVNDYIFAETDQPYKIVDNQGRIVSKNVYNKAATKLKEAITSGNKAAVPVYQNELDAKYKKVPLDGTEASHLTENDRAVTQQVNQLIDQTELMYDINKNIPKFSNAKDKYNFYLKAYNKAWDNSKTMYSNKKLDLGITVGDPARRNSVDNQIAQDLSGRKVYIASSNKDLSRILDNQSIEQGQDFNALVAAMEEKGYLLKDRTGAGFKAYNTRGSLPAADIKLTFENKDTKAPFILNIGAETLPNDVPQLIPLQRVMSAVAHMENADIPLTGGYKFRVNTGLDIKNNKGLSKINLVDPKGNVIDSSSGEDFPSMFQRLLETTDPAFAKQLRGK